MLQVGVFCSPGLALRKHTAAPSNIRVQEEPTLTQLVEEGLEDAEDEEEDDVPV